MSLDGKWQDLTLYAIGSLGMFVIVGIIYLVAATIVVVRASGWLKKILWALAFALVPTWDILLAEAYMHYRCSRDGGVRVYGTVTVKESELVLANCIEHGRLGSTVKQMSEDRNADCLYLPQRYAVVFSERTPLIFDVIREYDSFSDTATGKLLGESIGYGYTSGWTLFVLGHRGWTGGCPSHKDGEWRRFFDSVFEVDWQH